MKRLVVQFLAISFLVVAGAVAASAQVTETLVADIPFQFTVQDTTLPSGHYILRRSKQALPDAMELVSADGRSTVLFLVRPAELSNPPRQAELIFDRVGDQYFLSKLFEQENSIGAQLVRSRRERKMEDEGARVQTHARAVVMIRMQ